MKQMFLSHQRDRIIRPFTTLSLLLGLMSLTLTNPVLAQQREPQTLTVTGRGVEWIPTTKAQVRLGVEVQGKTAEEVQQEVARRSSAVVELLRSRQVEKLQTTGIQLNPIYRSDNNERRITGYSGTNIVSFRTTTEQAGKLIDDVIRVGATRIDGIGFSASDEAIATAQKQALRKATQEAQQQADVVLSTLNLTRKNIVRIQVDAPTPVFTGRDFLTTTRLEGRAVYSAADINTPIVSSEQQVQASVTLQISY